MSNFIIVTGGDATYFPLVKELLASLHANGPSPLPSIGVIDAGFTDAQRTELSVTYRCLIKTFSPSNPDAIKAIKKRPALTVNLAKLWLDKLFPGFDQIVFLDADSWVQDWRAIDLLLGASATGGLAVSPSWDRYRDIVYPVRWWLWRFPQLRSFNIKSARHARLPHKMRRVLAVRADLNAGVYALQTSAPHWARMQHWQNTILRHGKPFTSDGLAMALACHVDGLPLQPMTAFCNYLQKWLYNPSTGKFVDHFYPHEPVGIIHMADHKVIRFDKNARFQVPGIDGMAHNVSLRIQLCARPGILAGCGQRAARCQRIPSNNANSNRFKREDARTARTST